MEYLLLIHSDEKALLSATQEETGSILAAYGAYMKAMADAGVSKGGQRLRPTSTGPERQDPGSQRPLRRGQGAARRVFPHRRARSRRRDLLGRALSRRAIRRNRSAADLADVTQDWKAGERP
jgi:hypothetical protein